MGSIGKPSMSNEDKFIRDMVNDATSSIPVNADGGIDAGNLLSNSDVQAAVEAYVLEYGGDEDEILSKIRNGVEVQMLPGINKAIWSNDDIDRALSYLRANPNLVKRFDLGGSDGRVIRRIINSGVAEDFDRYDSDVAEAFITRYKRLRG